MPSAVDPSPASAPPTPFCVRSRTLHPLDVQAASPAAMARAPHKAGWPQESISPPYAPPSFPLDPALVGHAVLVGSPQGGLQVLASSPMPSPLPVSRVAFLPPQFQAGGAFQLLSQQCVHGVDPRVDPRVLQRTHSDAYGPAAFASHPTEQPLLYQLAAADQRSQAIGWGARDIVLRSPPLPRQRSAKACKKCRKRKTKCSGGDPCTRCTARSLECEYDEKSTLRGPMKARMESRKKLSAKDASASMSRSSTSNTHDQAPGNLSSYADKVPSVMQPAQDHQRSQASLPCVVHTVCVMPGDNGPDQLGMDPNYVQYVVGEPILAASPAAGTETLTPIDESNNASLIQGYTVPDNQESVLVRTPGPSGVWPTADSTSGSDASDHSRPPSVCSDYSSSDASSYSLASSDASFAPAAAAPVHLLWPPVSEYPLAARALSTSSSSSSLKDALVERHRAPPSPPAGADPAATLASGLSLARLSDTGSSPETSPAVRPAAPALQHAAPPLSGTGMTPAPQAWPAAAEPPAPAAALQFDDVFLWQPEPPAAAGVPADGAFARADASRENTLRGRGDGVLPRACAAADTDGTPRAADIFHFGAQPQPQPLGSPPGLHAMHARAVLHG